MLADGYSGVLRSYLHILIIRALRASSSGAGPVTPGRTDELVASFRQLIAEPGRSVTDCARQLGVSAGHLHSLVKQATGRTPGRLIRQQQTLTAKLLLARTDLTVRQVSKECGFGDPAYFCRFFRRETGMTPGEFRGNAGGNHHDPRLESIAAAPDGP